MARWLKTAKPAEERAEEARRVREVVERALEDIEKRGDAAVREMSIRFDSWDREDYRLAPEEIRACVDSVEPQVLDDIRFALEQVRGFAEKQRACMLDLEVETMPGVILGHRHIPVAAAGWYVPGGKYPLVASAVMSIATAKVAGVERVVTCAPPWQGRPSPVIVATQSLAGADEIWCLGGRSGRSRVALEAARKTPVSR